MYGPPPDCKWFEVVRKNSPRKCIRPLSGELCLRALDDDPYVSVLINPSVTRDAFSAMRANLLAIATTTWLRGARWASRCTRCPNPPVWYLTRNRPERAP